MINLPQENKEKLVGSSLNNSNFSLTNKIDKKNIQLLLKESYKKCIYCETSGNLDIEHYRPKGRVMDFDGMVTKQIIDENGNIHSGYFWLENELTNLLWVCHDCNAGEGGKWFKFPIKGSRIFTQSTNKQEWTVNSSTLLQEDPLLLHPLLDSPEEHLKINCNGKLQPIAKSRKGYMTIQVCNLNRNGLWLERRKKIIDDFFKEIQEQIGYLIEYENDNDINAIITEKGVERIVLIFKSKFNKIKENKEWSKEYSSVYKSIYQEFSCFIRKSSINKIISEPEIIFLTKIFQSYRENN